MSPRGPARWAEEDEDEASFANIASFSTKPPPGDVHNARTAIATLPYTLLESLKSATLGAPNAIRSVASTELPVFKGVERVIELAPTMESDANEARGSAWTHDHDRDHDHDVDLDVDVEQQHERAHVEDLDGLGRDVHARGGQPVAIRAAFAAALADAPTLSTHRCLPAVGGSLSRVTSPTTTRASAALSTREATPFTAPATIAAEPPTIAAEPPTIAAEPPTLEEIWTPVEPGARSGRARAISLVVAVAAASVTCLLIWMLGTLLFDHR